MTTHTLCQRCGHEVTIRSWPIGKDRAFEASCQNCGITKTGSVKQSGGFSVRALRGSDTPTPSES